MIDIIPFRQPGHDVSIIANGRRVGVLTVGGPDLTIVVEGGREVLFEMHHWHGPHPIDKKTLDPLDSIPRGFWDAIDRWQEGGMLVRESVCVTPKWCDKCRRTGYKLIHLFGKHYEVDGKCSECNGSRVVFEGQA